MDGLTISLHGSLWTEARRKLFWQAPSHRFWQCDSCRTKCFLVSVLCQLKNFFFVFWDVCMFFIPSLCAWLRERAYGQFRSRADTWYCELASLPICFACDWRRTLRSIRTQDKRLCIVVQKNLLFSFFLIFNLTFSRMTWSRRTMLGWSKSMRHCTSRRLTALLKVSKVSANLFTATKLPLPFSTILHTVPKLPSPSLDTNENPPRQEKQPSVVSMIQYEEWRCDNFFFER